jgi:flagellar biogenesis protein FliO
MHGYNNGWNWYWMVPTMLVLVVLIGAVVYAAVRLANRDSQQR